jgi:hypothetical protein
LDTRPTPIEPNDGDLLIEVGLGNSSKPVRLIDLSDLFGNIAKDYKKVNPGRELVIYRVIEGSIWTILRDAASSASGVASVLKFGKTIFDLVAALRSNNGVTGKTAVGLRTVESIAKTAAQSGSSIQFSYKKSLLKEEMSIRIEAPEALRIKARVAAIKRQPSTMGLKLRTDTDHLGLELNRLAVSGDTSLLATVASTLVSKGAGHLVKEIAEQFEADGYREAAAILRGSLPKTLSSKNPPRLT